MNTFSKARALLASASLNAAAATAAGSAAVLTTSIPSLSSTLRQMQSTAVERCLLNLTEGLLCIAVGDLGHLSESPATRLSWKQKRVRKAERKHMFAKRDCGIDPLARHVPAFGYSLTIAAGGDVPSLVRKWLPIPSTERNHRQRALVLAHESVSKHLRERVLLP